MKIDGIVLTVPMPANLMHFYCSKLQDVQKKYKSARRGADGTILFDLSKDDPNKLQAIVDAVKTAPNVTMRESRKQNDKNKSFLEMLDVRNQIHKGNGLSVEDIAKSIDVSKYDTSMIANDPEYKDEELHAFHNLRVYGITDTKADRVYVKFWVPGKGNPEIVSMHRSNEQKHF